MPKLPFRDFPGSASYFVRRDKLCLQYRFPQMEKFRKTTSRFRESLHQKKQFFEWARKFLKSGGEVPEDWKTREEADAQILAGLDETITLGEATRLYLRDCEHGNRWMAPKAPDTISTQTRPILSAFENALGSNVPLTSVVGDQIAEFVRGLGGKKETKERHLCPISNLFKWALKEKHVAGENPAQGIVFWREAGEEPHDGLRKNYSEEQFRKLLRAAATDPFALDAIYFGRYLATRPQDAVALRWEHWKWDLLLVVVPRIKTKGQGVEFSYVDMHPELAQRYAHMRGEQGYCLSYQGNRSRIAWPANRELRQMVAEAGYRAVGRELGVSDNAVRKRLNRQVGRARLGRRRTKSREQEQPEPSRPQLAETLSTKVSLITRNEGLHEEGVQPYYVLRHTFACQSLLAGRPPAVVAAEMGISLDTVMRYYFHAIPRSELDGDRPTNSWGLRQEDLDDTAPSIRRSG